MHLLHGRQTEARLPPHRTRTQLLAFGAAAAADHFYTSRTTLECFQLHGRPDGSKIAAASLGAARVWSSSSGEPLLTLTEGRGVRHAVDDMSMDVCVVRSRSNWMDELFRRWLRC
jgi:hypothetical protein